MCFDFKKPELFKYSKRVLSRNWCVLLKNK